jgi:hypothetical protein
MLAARNNLVPIRSPEAGFSSGKNNVRGNRWYGISRERYARGYPENERHFFFFFFANNRTVIISKLNSWKFARFKKHCTRA